jgi:RNA-directed DNA polymerase
MQLPKIIPVIKKLLELNGFRLNNKKIKVQRRHKRMTVTGVVVNEKPNISRNKRRNLRAELHNLKGQKISKKKFQVLSGKVAWIAQLNPSHGAKLESQLKEITY